MKTAILIFSVIWLINEIRDVIKEGRSNLFIALANFILNIIYQFF